MNRHSIVVDILSLLGALLLLVMAGPVRADEVSDHYVAVDGTLRTNPCTLELMKFDGYLHIQARATREGRRAHVDLHIITEGVTATGQLTGARFSSSEILNESVTIERVPDSGAAVVGVDFSGPGGVAFRAWSTLHVAVDLPGDVNAVAIALDEIKLECTTRLPK